MAEDVYDGDYLEAMVDNDELSANEAGLMHWYDVDAERSFQDEAPGFVDEESEYM